MVVAAIALGIGLLSLVIALVAMRRARRPGGSLEPARVSEVGDAERLALLGAQLETLARRLDAAESRGEMAIQRIGVVRYNPFADTGSNQSFVLAFLDARGNGFLLSSLHSRQQSRVFLKPIVAGKAETAVSEEEAEALRRAGIN